MKNEIYKENQSFIEKILDHKALILIVAGFAIRFFMLFYFYFTHTENPLKSWGDVNINYRGSVYYPPLTMFLLDLFRVLSFGMVEIFAFWGFLMEIIVVILFYFVLKSFAIPNKEYVYGLFLINPFFFLNNVFSFENCGYHITDSFFFIFFFLALYFYPKEEEWCKYLFYFFLTLSAVAKIYTLPIMALFFIKFLMEKDWDEMKKFLICSIPLVLIFLVAPIFFIEDYVRLYFLWNNVGETTLPLFIRMIPALVITGLYMVFRLKEVDLIEIPFVAILITVSFLFFTNPYIRYFQPILILIILTPKEFFTFKLNFGFIQREIRVDNNLVTFYFSIVCVFLAYLIIIYVL